LFALPAFGLLERMKFALSAFGLLERMKFALSAFGLLERVKLPRHSVPALACRLIRPPSFVFKTG
jgi:hypothetical protein